MIRRILLIFALFLFITVGVNAQYNYPAGRFWSLDGGIGMSGILVEGSSFQLVIDPKLWLSPSLMVGSRLGVNYSIETEASDLSNILTFEGQVYLRWNFLNLGSQSNPINIFLQGGIGLISAYRGKDNPFNDVTKTRGSLMFDAALGVTIPLSERWHIEPSVRGGYPHIWGASLTAGYKFPLPRSTVQYRTTEDDSEYSEIIRTIPPNEIIKRILITSIEFILFGPDIGRYNVGIDQDAQALNELTLNFIAKTLRDNPDYRVRIEGHANPVTPNSTEAGELLALSEMRANTVAAQLRAKGVKNEQIIVIAYGGTRTVTSDHDIWNRNRRVELMIIQVDTGQ
jgi:outer membrane protein OmpA-like peptidoglycan-associated protein